MSTHKSWKQSRGSSPKSSERRGLRAKTQLGYFGDPKRRFPYGRYFCAGETVPVPYVVGSGNKLVRVI